MATSQELPKNHRALVLSSVGTPPEVQVIATPQPGPGSVVVRILVSNVVGYSRDVYDGTRKYFFPTPLVIGPSGIGRVAATGPDATTLREGQLVFIDCFIKGRDDPKTAFLLGVSEGPNEGSKILMHGEWRDGTYAEYAKLPLENCYPLNDTGLLNGLGYKIEEIADISRLIIPYGGLSDINLKAGETIIISPATGPFGGAAVEVALAMGAKVIALGRNLKVLKRLSKNNERVEMVQITGDLEGDTKNLQQFGPVDAFFDISPPAAANSTHIKSAILALKHSGRVSLMGGIRGDISIPHSAIMRRDLQLKGKWMYSRDNVRELIQMIEAGVLKIDDRNGQRKIGKFALEDWKNAFDTAAENSGTGDQVVLVPTQTGTVFNN